VSRDGRSRTTPSVLYPAGARPHLAHEQPPFFRDLNLDQVVKAALVGREEYRLASFFYSPLHDEDQVRYRQEVARDLDRRDAQDVVRAFARWMRQARFHLHAMADAKSPLYKQGRFLEAAWSYCMAVASLLEGLERLQPASQGLRDFAAYLSEYAASGEFIGLRSEVEALRSGLGRVNYSLLISANRVTVGRFEDEPDLSRLVAAAFYKFTEGSTTNFVPELDEGATANHVHAQILQRVARLYPEAFARLERFFSRWRDFMDPTVVAFDREVQFYRAYATLMSRLEATGTRFCYPEVSATCKQVEVRGGADIALALALSRYGKSAVGNDVLLTGLERILVVTGPNQGGKTTFARMFGQLHYLAALGLPVPAERARLFLPDRVFTHFEREERLSDLQGRLNEELLRVRDILATATSSSVVVMNESFSSTAFADSLFIGTKVLGKIAGLGALAVYVTFVDELANFSSATVSMVADVPPEDPGQRTYRVVRKQADGRAYASALAKKYGLTYPELLARLGQGERP
jgi:DNA mismatch repair protein MutS